MLVHRTKNRATSERPDRGVESVRLHVQPNTVYDVLSDCR